MLVINTPYKILKIDAYQTAGTISKFEFFLTTITSTEKQIGITKATRFPNSVPSLKESPIMIIMPLIAKIIEAKLIAYIFSFK